MADKLLVLFCFMVVFVGLLVPIYIDIRWRGGQY
jgi:hypothetical protein